MKKIDHFILPESTNSLYKNEAISSIGLTREVADKINELVDAYNRLNTTDLEWKQTQEGIIRKGVLYMKDNLLNSLNDLLVLFRDSGYIDDRIEYHCKLLQAQLDNLLGSVKEGSTTLDAELIALRTTAEGIHYENVWQAIHGNFSNSNILIYNNNNNASPELTCVPFNFDFENGCVAIEPNTIVVRGNVQLLVTTERIALNIPYADNKSTVVLLYHLDTNSFTLEHIYSSKIDKLSVPVAVFHNYDVSTMTNSLYCPYPHIIDGKAPLMNSQVKNSIHQFGICGNAFGTPFDIDMNNSVVTIPQHTYIFDGCSMIGYNGDASIELPFDAIESTKVLLYNRTKNEWAVEGLYTGILIPDDCTIVVASWWHNQPNSVISASNYTVNGITPPQYNKIVDEVSSSVIGKINLLTESLFDKKILVIGDSISTDYYGNYSKWVTKLCESGFFDSDKVTNNSIHATGFVARYEESGEDNDFVSRLKKIENPEAYDLVIVFGGINDYIQNIEESTFKSSVDDFFSYLIENFTESRICVFSPMRTFATWENTAGKFVTDYCDYISSVAKSYSLPLLNLTDESGFHPWISSFKDRWTLTPEGYSESDGVHPTEEYIEKFLAPMIHKFLKGLL